MKLLISAAVVFAAAAMTTPGARADVVRAAVAPAIDGDLSDAAWSKATWETGFRKFEREKRRDEALFPAAMSHADHALHPILTPFPPALGISGSGYTPPLFRR